MSLVFDVNGTGAVDQQSFQAPGAYDHVSEPDQLPPAPMKHGKKDLGVVERAANKLYLSTQYTKTTNAVKIVSGREGRAWVQLLNTGNYLIWLGESDSQLNTQDPAGFQLAAGASVSWPTESAVWAISPLGNSSVSIAVGENTE